MENSGKKYQIDTEENKMFLGELQKNLLNFGKGFLSNMCNWHERLKEPEIIINMWMIVRFSQHQS